MNFKKMFFIGLGLIFITAFITGCGESGGESGGGSGPEYTLNITCNGLGKVTDTSGYAIISHKIKKGTTVTLVPVGETGGWVFSQWTGENGDEVENNLIMMNGNKNITAVFNHLTCQVNITVVGQGTVNQELVMGAMSIPNYKGDQVKLVPAPDPGWDLDHWEGDLNTTELTPVMTVDSNKNITAVFTPVVNYNEFNEDSETQIPMVRPEGTWSKTTSSSHSPTHCWTDSPSGNYNRNTDMSLTTRAINMTGSQDPFLVFWHRYNVDYFNCRVELSITNGANWISLKSYTGTNSTWTQEIINLNAYKTQEKLLIRFRFYSSYAQELDGWYIDDISIKERVLISNYYDDAETGSALMVSDGIWGKTTSRYYSPSNSWTDSPIGKYATNTDTSLTSITLDLSGTMNPCLYFWNQYMIGYYESYGYGWVEITTDGGNQWTQLKSYHGWESSWKEEIIHLNAYKGQSNVKIRFRLVNNGISTYDGWYIDDIGLYDFH